METRKALLLLDSAPEPEWNYAQLLTQQTGLTWVTWHADSHFADASLLKKCKFFILPLRLLAHRRAFEIIYSYQQFYGLVYAFYCDLLGLKKCGHLLVATFIYRPKAGLKGRLYAWFMRRAVQSGAVDRILCYSQSEIPYYEALFNVPAGKFVYLPLGLGDRIRSAPRAFPPEERYILSAGKSNRDYAFLLRALGGTPYSVRVLTDTCPQPRDENIRVYTNVYDEAYFDMLARCYCVVICLEDKHISAGQLVLLQAMMYCKPVIATYTETTAEYIRDGETGFLIRTQTELLERLHRLYAEPALYRQIAANGRLAFLREHSLARMAQCTADILRQIP